MVKKKLSAGKSPLYGNSWEKNSVLKKSPMYGNSTEKNSMLKKVQWMATVQKELSVEKSLMNGENSALKYSNERQWYGKNC